MCEKKRSTLVIRVRKIWNNLKIEKKKERKDIVFVSNSNHSLLQ